MAKKTDGDGKHQDDGSSDIGRAAVVSGLAANEGDHEGKRSDGEDHTSCVDGKAAYPFLQIVSVSLKDEPFIAEKCERNPEQVGHEAGENVSVRKERRQDQREQRVAAEAEDRVASADSQVSNYSDRSRNGWNWRRRCDFNCGRGGQFHGRRYR